MNLKSSKMCIIVTFSVSCPSHIYGQEEDEPRTGHTEMETPWALDSMRKRKGDVTVHPCLMLSTFWWIIYSRWSHNWTHLIGFFSEMCKRVTNSIKIKGLEVATHVPCLNRVGQSVHQHSDHREGGVEVGMNTVTHLPAPNRLFHLASKVYPQLGLILIPSKTPVPRCLCPTWLQHHHVSIFSWFFPMPTIKHLYTYPPINGCQVSHWPNPPICVSVWRIHQEMREWTARMLGLDFSLGTCWNISQAHP